MASDNKAFFVRESELGLDTSERQRIIKSTLDIYKDEFVGLKDFEARQDGITGYFFSDCYPLARQGLLSYLTAPMANLYLAQLGYVLARLKFESLVGDTVTADLFDGSFFTLRDEGKILITNIDRMKFDRRLPLGQEIKLDFSVVRTLWTRSYFAVKLKFSFENDATTGNFTTIITKS